MIAAKPNVLLSLSPSRSRRWLDFKAPSFRWKPPRIRHSHSSFFLQKTSLSLECSPECWIKSKYLFPFWAYLFLHTCLKSLTIRQNENSIDLTNFCIMCAVLTSVIYIQIEVWTSKLAFSSGETIAIIVQYVFVLGRSVINHTRICYVMPPQFWVLSVTRKLGEHGIHHTQGVRSRTEEVSQCGIPK